MAPRDIAGNLPRKKVSRRSDGSVFSMAKVSMRYDSGMRIQSRMNTNSHEFNCVDFAEFASADYLCLFVSICGLTQLRGLRHLFHRPLAPPGHQKNQADAGADGAV